MKMDVAALVAEKKTLCFCTIGTPRVGNRAFCDSVVTMLAPLKEAGLLQFNRIVCNLDVIATIPMYIEGFCHVCPPAAFVKQSDGEYELMLGVHQDTKHELLANKDVV